MFGEGWGWWQRHCAMAASFMHCKTDALSVKVMLRVLCAPPWAQPAPGRRRGVQL